MAWCCDFLNWLRRHPWRVLGVLALLGVGAALAAPHLRAWYHLRAGRAALERCRNPEALAHVQACLRVWPSSTTAHLLASRAARRLDDFAEAEYHLREYQRLKGGTADEIAFEWALLHAAGGDLGEVEPFLLDRARGPQAALVWEALAQGCTTVYRIRAALACLDHWLKLEPDNIRALTLRGDIWWQTRSLLKASWEYARVVALDPEQEEVRWRLARCYLENGQYADALSHLEFVAGRRPGDPDVLSRIARCQNMLGKTKQARQTLEAVLKEHPEHAQALRARGQMALMDGDAASAARWLRDAVRAAPQDYEANWSLYQALKLLPGKEVAAKEQAARAEQVKEQTEKLTELTTRKMSERPHDPAVHCELGTLLIRMGHKEVGHRWLLSALKEDPGYRPAHAALADYYQARGEAEQAAEHRQQAQ